MRSVSEDLQPTEIPFFSFPGTNVSNKVHKLMKPHNSCCQLCHLDSIYPILGDSSVCYCVVNVPKQPKHSSHSLPTWQTGSNLYTLAKQLLQIH